MIWTVVTAAAGAGCGWGAVTWANGMLRRRNRQERLSRSVFAGLVALAAVCGGVIGFCIREWLPAAGALAVLTIGLAVAVADWLCRIIPNPTVLAVFGLKLLLMAAALLHIPGAPTFRVLSSLIGMVFCLLVFSAPGLMGKRVGAGDIKLAAAMGFLLELQTTLIAIVVMGVLMLGYSVFQRKMPLLVFLKTDIPMGPFLAAGMLLAWMLPYFPW